MITSSNNYEIYVYWDFYSCCEANIFEFDTNTEHGSIKNLVIVIIFI